MWMHGLTGMLFGWLFWLAVIAGVVLLVVRALRHPARGPVPTCCSAGALDELNRRYARGEITRAQFEQLKHDINA